MTSPENCTAPLSAIAIPTSTIIPVGDDSAKSSPRNSSLSTEGRCNFRVPPSDLAEFARLPQSVQFDLRRKLGIMLAISSALNPRIGSVQQASIHEGLRGHSASRLRSLYAAYVQNYNWRVLLNKASAGPAYWRTAESITLPFLFLEYWRSLCGQNKRKCKPAYDKLISQWLRWRRGDTTASIPGYSDCPIPEPATDLPPGWTYSNLMRRSNAPTKYELVADRIGRSAADAYRPLVLMTRQGLRVGQYFCFDDFWHDFKVIVPGQRRAQRLLQFHGLDLASACNFARGYKPVMEDLMSQAEQRLKEADMVFLLAHVLGNIGYSPSGTVLVVEHGTAAIRPDLESLIKDLTSGLVTVERSGMKGSPAYAGVYPGASKGNFRFKAWLESQGNLLHNAMADAIEIPGQVGSNSRTNLPEELHGRDKHAVALLKAMAALPADRAQLLRLPFLDYRQAQLLSDAITDRLNARVDHELEGWSDYTTTEWRITPDLPWLPTAQLAALDPARRAAIEAVITADPNLVRTRKLSPFEVWQAGRCSLIQLPPEAVALILATIDSGPGARTSVRRTVTIRDNMIQIQDASLSPEPLYYEPLLSPFGPSSPSGPSRLRQDTTWSVVINPFDLTRCHIFNSRGGYLGFCPIWQRVRRDDAEALKRACGRALKAESDLLAPVAARGAAITRQRTDDALHNAAVLRGDILSPQEAADNAEQNRLRAIAEAAL